MLNKRSIVILVIMVAVLMLAGFATYYVKKTSDLANSDAAQTLGTDENQTYANFDGQSVSLKDFEGTVRVVNSWASWSPFSKTELQELNQLAIKYADKDVHVIAINRNEDSLRAKKYIDQLGELEHINFLMDGDDTFYDRMDGKAMPETLFFDRRGNITTHARGELTFEQMEQYLLQAIESK